jgi:hypothetical protein
MESAVFKFLRFQAVGNIQRRAGSVVTATNVGMAGSSRSWTARFDACRKYGRAETQIRLEQLNQYGIERRN